MRILDFYGQDKTSPVADWQKVFQVQPYRIGPQTAEYEAIIVGAREYRLNLTPLVLDENGSLCGWPDVQVAHSNPAVRGVGDGGRGVQTQGGMAELFTTTEAGTNGLQLGGGSKIGPGGPVDTIWVEGLFFGLPIVSDVVKVGLYSSDIVMSPVFLLRKKGSGGPITQPPAQPGGLTKEAIAAMMNNLATEVLKL